ncbi:phosphoglycerate mutase family protein [Enterococcus avium]|uniref:phosphoglycerate mutase family protein n=1 Tax=Enterococcus avium TaxID=33945 RepID=UPI000668CA52|nr:histidine phosphatase family protein [Enterococcus avium]
MIKKLYLMRHGETLFNVLKKVQGACDSPLTEKGIQQAKLARDFFKKMALNLIIFTPLPKKERATH